MDETPETLFHASPSANRESIAKNGLNVALMVVSGIAGSAAPEAAGVHLAGSLWEAFWYASFRVHVFVDIWEVRATGLALREVQSGWICEEVVPPVRLTLLATNVTPELASNRLDSWDEIDAEG